MAAQHVKGWLKQVVWVTYRAIGSTFFPNCCRFYPSCSVYAQTAWARFGYLKGTWLVICRLIRCHPFHPGGVDPVPDQ